MKTRNKNDKMEIKISNNERECEMVTHTDSQRADNLSAWPQRDITLAGYYAGYKYSQNTRIRMLL